MEYVPGSHGAFKPPAGAQEGETDGSGSEQGAVVVAVVTNWSDELKRLVPTDP